MKIDKDIAKEIEELTQPQQYDTSLLLSGNTQYVSAISDYEYPLCTKANKKIMLTQLESAYANALADSDFDKDDLHKLYHCFKNAQHFIELLKPKHMVPEIYIEPDAEIAFDWIISKTKYLSVSINEKSELIHAVVYHNSRSRGKDIFTNEIPDQLLFQIERFSKDSLQKR
jgi:hypothetical protein